MPRHPVQNQMRLNLNLFWKEGRQVKIFHWVWSILNLGDNLFLALNACNN